MAECNAGESRGDARFPQSLGDRFVLAQGDLGYLREIQRTLRHHELPSELLQPPEGCGSS